MHHLRQTAATNRNALISVVSVCRQTSFQIFRLLARAHGIEIGAAGGRELAGPILKIT